MFLGPLRRLTAEEAAKEVRDTQTRTWPHNSVLPVKNLYDQRVGCIFRTYDGGPETIEPEVVLAEKRGEPLRYPSLEKLVEAGWVAD
jgi:hypothetical protein